VEGVSSGVRELEEQAEDEAAALVKGLKGLVMEADGHLASWDTDVF